MTHKYSFYDVPGKKFKCGNYCTHTSPVYAAYYHCIPNHCVFVILVLADVALLPFMSCDLKESVYIFDAIIVESPHQLFSARNA